MASTNEPLNWGGTQEMTEFEATMWRGNRHPENSTQGGVLEVLGTDPGFEAMRRFHEYGLGKYPRFKQKVVEPALPVGPPIWVDDAAFDLDHHLRHATLPAPGTHEQLLEESRRWALKPLDAHRPPWLGVFIDGLEGGRSAYFLVVHHCLMDGHGSVQLFADLHNRPAEEPDADTPGTEPAPSQTPGTWAVAAGQVVDRALKAPGFAGKLLGVAAQAVRKPEQAAGFAASVALVVSPPRAAGSELLGKGSRTNWSYGTLTCDLMALRAAGKAVGGTINDAYVCSILGGLRRYHEAAGIEIGDVVVNMPVSVRTEGDLKGGNKFAPAFLSAPASVADPAARMKAFREVVARASGEPALDFMSVLLPVLNRAPAGMTTPLFTAMQNRTDVTISNVPGMPEPATLAGAPVEGFYYFGPLPGSPLMVVLHSYAGTAYIAVNCDGDVFDSMALMACLQNGLDEILSLPATAGSGAGEGNQ